MRIHNLCLEGKKDNINCRFYSLKIAFYYIGILTVLFVGPVATFAMIRAKLGVHIE